MIFYHDSRSELYRNPLGAAPCKSRVRLRVRASELSDLTLRIWWQNAEKRMPMHPVDGDLYECTVALPKTTGVFWYYFIAKDDGGATWCLGNADDGLGGIGSVHPYEPQSFQITVYDPAYRTPEWMRNGVMMQIMVDRFRNAGGTDARNLPAGCYYHANWDDDPALVINDRRGNLCANDFFGGNLRGIEEKLDYIEGMGVTALYLNPIFKSSSNHKYNTGDYRTIDPSFGTEADFIRLCAEAKKRGIRIVLDGVFSHTGSDSVYFDIEGKYGGDGAYQNPHGPYSTWYTFTHWPDEYESWWGFKTLPNVNEEDPSYRRFILGRKNGVIDRWLLRGAGGWRLDVADELPMDFIRDLRARVKGTDPDACVIGEVWEDPSKKVSYGELRSYCTGDTLDAAMNYPLRDLVLGFFTGRINAPEFARCLDSMRENQPAQFFYSQMNLLGSHDKARALSVLADVGNMEPDRKYRYPIELKDDEYARGRRRLIAAWNLICALPGMPCIYYGDEAGLYGMSDPYCRGTYPWGHEDHNLIEAFRAASLRRGSVPALRTGDLRIRAIGENVLLIERSIENGRDLFGNAQENGCTALAANRAHDSQWIEYNGATIEIPAESALWLD